MDTHWMNRVNKCTIKNTDVWKYYLCRWKWTASCTIGLDWVVFYVPANTV